MKRRRKLKPKQSKKMSMRPVSRPKQAMDNRDKASRMSRPCHGTDTATERMDPDEAAACFLASLSLPPQPDPAAAMEAPAPLAADPEAAPDGFMGLMDVRPANQWNAQAETQPEPENLWNGMWHENEVACLFSDSNLGKSILAVQIGLEIARRRRVVYCDFEMSARSFQKRYSHPDGRSVRLPDNFLRAELDEERLATLCDGSLSVEDAMIAAIESCAVATGSSVVIVDNITYVNQVTEKGDMAGAMMLKLLQLKKRRGLSMLILAHTPKRLLSAPITQNDLAGSKKIFNFLDAAFAIGMSAKDPSLRYIKHLKCRGGSIVHDSSNVMVCEIDRIGGVLQFVPRGTDTESAHLRQSSDDNGQLRSQVQQLRAEGRTIRDIASTLGISRSTAHRLTQSAK